MLVGDGPGPGADPRGAFGAFHRAGQGSASLLTVFPSPGYTEEKIKFLRGGECRKEKEQIQEQSRQPCIVF